MLSVINLHEAHWWAVSLTVCFYPPCTSQYTFVFPCADNITTRRYLVSLKLIQACCSLRPEICWICLLVISSPTALLYTVWQHLNCYQNRANWSTADSDLLMMSDTEQYPHYLLGKTEWENRCQPLSAVSIIMPCRHYNNIVVWATHSLPLFSFHLEWITGNGNTFTRHVAIIINALLNDYLSLTCLECLLRIFR